MTPKHVDFPTANNMPWQLLGVDPNMVNPIPSMIVADESLYLYWLTREKYSGMGEIVDCGPLLGGSTHSLAAGLAANPAVPNKRKRIHSFDLFKYFEDFRSNLLPKSDLKNGDSLLPIFLDNVNEYLDYLDVTAGDVRDATWGETPIEILFIDLAKSPEINRHVVNSFFPSLIPNHSIVVQQDYFHYQCYWLHLTMQLLADHFKVIHTPDGGSLSFLCTKSIPKGLDLRWTKDEAIQLLDKAIEPLLGFWRLLVKTAKVSLLVDFGDYNSALELARDIRQSRDFNQLVGQDLESALANIPAFDRAKGKSVREKMRVYEQSDGYAGILRAGLSSIWRRLFP
jgi:hypothetical protein